MPLISYKEARPWARAIREAVLLKRMPPWHADPHVSKAFVNDRSLSQNEINTIIQWVDQGAKEGASIPYPAPVKAASGWKLGKPDWVYQVPGFKILKDGPIEYTFLIAPTGFTKDTWVQAAEFKIDQRSSVHHMNAFVRGPNSSYVSGYAPQQFFTPTKSERVRPREGERTFDRRQLLLGYEPGYEAISWEPGQAKLIKAGSDIVFEAHYTSSGKELIDNSQFGLYIAKESPAQRMLSIQAANESFAIPPGDPNYKSEAVITFAKPAKLVSIQPHMHLRGKSMEIKATYRTGKSEVLLDVPAYNFNWQTTYFLKKPVILPAGTRVDCVARFDNSPNNRFNPDPTKTVKWGDQSWDEMHIGFLDVVFDATVDAETVLDPLRSQRVDIHKP